MRLKIALRAAEIIAFLGIISLLPAGTSRLILLLVVMVELAILFKRTVVNATIKDRVKNLITALFSIVMLFLLLESAFMYVKRSNAFGDTLASRLWFDKYWHPLNSYGFRDVEPTKDTGSSLFFIGDSFTAGHGIKNPADRFSNIVKDKLNKDGAPLEVINLGSQGADTRDEYTTMTDFIKASGKKPACIVLQYFGNDIENVAQRNGLKFDVFKPYAELNPISKYLVKKSFFLNYCYWLIPGRGYSSYFEFLAKGYSDNTIFNQHKEDLRLFTSYAADKKIPILVLIFPFMQDAALSKTLYADKLKTWFKQENVHFIDVAGLIDQLPVSQRVVNSNDGHASVAVNRLVGNAVYVELSSRLLTRNDSIQSVKK